MPYTLITVVTPSEPTQARRGGPFGRQLPGPFSRAGGVGSHLPQLSEPPELRLLFLFVVFLLFDWQDYRQPSWLCQTFA
jgi:hypothetical protein